jgi:hypothetical protein
MNINDKVKVNFGNQINKKGNTCKTNFIIGRITKKKITQHCFDNGRNPEIIESYLIVFDEEYFLERSDKYKLKLTNSKRYITELVYINLPINKGCLYLKPISMELI